MFLSQEIDRKTISNLYKNSFICSRTLTNESAIYWSRVSVCMTGLVYCTSIGGSFDTDFYIILSIISIKNKNKNYKIIIGENLSYKYVSLGYLRFQIGCVFAEYDLCKLTISIQNCRYIISFL